MNLKSIFNIINLKQHPEMRPFIYLAIHELKQDPDSISLRDIIGYLESEVNSANQKLTKELDNSSFAKVDIEKTNQQLITTLENAMSCTAEDCDISVEGNSFISRRGHFIEYKRDFTTEIEYLKSFIDQRSIINLPIIINIIGAPNVGKTALSTVLTSTGSNVSYFDCSEKVNIRDILINTSSTTVIIDGLKRGLCSIEFLRTLWDFAKKGGIIIFMSSEALDFNYLKENVVELRLTSATLSER